MNEREVEPMSSLPMNRLCLDLVATRSPASPYFSERVWDAVERRWNASLPGSWVQRAKIPFGGES
jgi:hypothetical protein